MLHRIRTLHRALLATLNVGTLLAVALPTIAQTPAPQKAEKIEVTGSSIKRIEGETALPVQVITRDDIQKSGLTTAAEVIERFPGSVGGYNFTIALGDSARPGFSGASLRGLGGNNTLVLLNGRRIANYAFDGGAVDLNSIPISAIDRVEILKDGASAIYGTDAIGGVINFILRKDVQGVEGSAYGTHTEAGGGNNQKYTLTAGYGDLTKQRFNIFASFDYDDSKRLRAAEREFSRTAFLPSDGVNKLSFNAFPANIFQPDGTIFNPAFARGCAPPVSVPDPRIAGLCGFDYASVIDIYPPATRKSAVVRGTLQLSDDHQLFAEFVGSKNEISFAVSPTPASEVTTFAGAQLLYPEGGRYYPQGAGLTGPLNLYWRSIDAGPRTNLAKSESRRFVLGAQGVLAGWDYNGAFNYSESKASDNYTDGWLSESRIIAAMATGDINPFGPQDARGAQLINGAKVLQEVRNAKGTTKSADIKVSKELSQLAAGPLALALGAEHRKEDYRDNPFPILNTGDIIGSGGNQLPLGGDRDVTALFGELSIPIFKGLEAQLAVRHDRYSDFGNTTNPKVALRYQPNKTWLVRGSYNTGFRAPSLPELYTPVTQTNAANPWDDPERCAITASLRDCNNQFNVRQGGNANLKPEKSKQWTAGFVIEPTQALSFSADYWNIERRETINTLTDVAIFGNYATYRETRIVRKPRDAQFPNLPGEIDYLLLLTENLGETRTAGVDVNLNVRTRNSLGRWRFNFDGTYIRKFDYQQERGGPFIHGAGNYGAPLEGAGDPVPRWRHTASINWDAGSWSATLAENFVGHYTDAFPDVNGNPRTVGVYETWDLQGSYTGIKNLQLTLGVKNVFDRDPPFTNQGTLFIVGADTRLADPRGRTYYGRVTYSFK